MYQRELDIQLNKPYEELSYNTSILPLIKRCLTDFETKHLKLFPTNNISTPIDFYTELVTHIIITNYLQSTQIDIPNECYILMLLRYPYFINILQCNKTFAEYKSFRKSLSDTLDIMYPSKTNQNVIHVQNLLNTNITETYNIRKCSAVHYFHYFIGFRFDNRYIAVTPDKLPNDADCSYFIVNLSYNLKKLSSIIIYHDNPKIKNKILNPVNIPKYKCLEKPSIIIRATEPFISVDTNFEKIEYYKQKVYILL